ncbi:MAG: helix-hairpin-helix domain-containing protein [Candidatus Omnitrophica bacterium]|nr:helix-hairpin-helix domain-containing protein [Candidatus Omnitrophota bacterium]
MRISNLVRVIFIFFSVQFSLFSGELRNGVILISRRAKNQEFLIVSPFQKLLSLLGNGLQTGLNFDEGIELFRQIERLRLSVEETEDFYSFIANNLVDFLVVSERSGIRIDLLDIRDLFSAAQNYALGIRRDELGLNRGGRALLNKMLSVKDIKIIGEQLLEALDSSFNNGRIDKANYLKYRERLEIITLMAGLWATSPVSSKSMLRALEGGNTAIMAANTQMSVSIPGLMLASLEFGAPLMFESAMSEVNLQDPNDPAKIAIGYIGRNPQEFAEVVRYYAFLLGYDLPYAIHADHTTVSKDTAEAIDYAKRLNQAQLSAGYTSFAIDPSSLPAVREDTQLKTLNAMEVEEFLRLGFDESLAKTLAAREFKKLKELSSIEGIDERKINILMDYIESQILVAVLNKMGYEDLMSIPRMPGTIARAIVENGPFTSLEELKEIDGLGDDDIFYIEGIDNAVLLFDYLKAYLDLKRIIEINIELAKFIPEEFGLEVEVGHIGRVDPLTGEAVMTTPLEAVVLIEALQRFGIKPQLLAVNNGTKHGIVFIGGKEVPTTVDVKRTDEIASAIRPLGVSLAQHGTTGTPFEVIKDQLAGNILKANVGTEWRRTVLRSMPLDLFYRMVEWTVEEEKRKAPEKFSGLLPVRSYTREQLLSSECPYYALIIDPIKRAIGVFRAEIDNISGEDLDLIVETTREVAREYFTAFNALEKVWKIVKYLGWGW